MREPELAELSNYTYMIAHVGHRLKNESQEKISSVSDFEHGGMVGWRAANLDPIVCLRY